MIRVLYQNVKTDGAFDVTATVKAAKWTTKRTGSPASIELTVQADSTAPQVLGITAEEKKIIITEDVVVWDFGGIVAVMDGDTGIFYGYVFKLSQNEKGEISVTAYDQTRYLKNKDTYVFKGQRADQITAQIAADFGIHVGELADTGYVIPSMIEDSQTLFDIILKALDHTLINTNKMFYLWDDFGLLRISDVAASKLDLFVGDSSLATGYTYAADIDSDTYNKIKLVRDNKETGKRDVYLFQDSNNMKFWGVLQDYEKVNESLGEAQIKARGDQMIALYNRPKRSFDVTALSDLSVRAGRVLFIGISDILVNQFFIVDEASHDLLKNTMSLKLKVV